MSLPDRATLANMAPEYGATMGFFPVDDETLRYLERTGRTPQEVDLVERYYKEQGMFRTAASPEPRFHQHAVARSVHSGSLDGRAATSARPRPPGEHEDPVAQGSQGDVRQSAAGQSD